MAEHESRAESASLRLELAEERRGQSPTETWEIMGKTTVFLLVWVDSWTIFGAPRRFSLGCSM